MQRYKIILLRGEQSVCRVKVELHGRYIWNSKELSVTGANLI